MPVRNYYPAVKILSRASSPSLMFQPVVHSSGAAGAVPASDSDPRFANARILASCPQGPTDGTGVQSSGVVQFTCGPSSGTQVDGRLKSAPAGNGSWLDSSTLSSIATEDNASVSSSSRSSPFAPMATEVEVAVNFLTHLVKKRLNRLSTATAMATGSNSANLAKAPSPTQGSAANTGVSKPAANTGSAEVANTSGSSIELVAQEDVEAYGVHLTAVLYEYYADHWFPLQPWRGMAYRCLRINGKLDERMTRAAELASLDPVTFRDYFPPELTVWVDPGQVSYRIGEDGSVCDLFKGDVVLEPPSAADTPPPPMATMESCPNIGGIYGGASAYSQQRSLDVHAQPYVMGGRKGDEYAVYSQQQQHQLAITKCQPAGVSVGGDRCYGYQQHHQHQTSVASSPHLSRDVVGYARFCPTPSTQVLSSQASAAAVLTPRSQWAPVSGATNMAVHSGGRSGSPSFQASSGLGSYGGIGGGSSMGFPPSSNHHFASASPPVAASQYQPHYHHHHNRLHHNQSNSQQDGSQQLMRQLMAGGLHPTASTHGDLLVGGGPAAPSHSQHDQAALGPYGQVAAQLQQQLVPVAMSSSQHTAGSAASSGLGRAIGGLGGFGGRVVEHDNVDALAASMDVLAMDQLLCKDNYDRLVEYMAMPPSIAAYGSA